MMRFASILLLAAIPFVRAFAGDATNVEPRIVHDIRAQLPPDWNCSVYQSDAVKAVPHGLEKPVFQVVASNTNLSFVLSTNAPHPRMQSPVVPLYFYRHSEKAGIMKIIEKEKIYSWNIPIYFGETDEFVVVTSPAYVNGGLFTLEARRGLRPMWKVLRDLIPNKENTGVEGAAPDPRFIVDRERLLRRHKNGLTILAADQCPMVPKCVAEIAEVSRTLGLKPKVVRVRSAEASRELPTPYGMFSIIYDGKLIAGRPVGATRFSSMMREHAGQSPASDVLKAAPEEQRSAGRPCE